MIRRNSFRSRTGLAQKVTIRLLDDNEVLEVDFQPHQNGQFLMDYVCRELNIAEKDYFGLRFVDSSKQRHWMDLGKSITKQLKEMTPFIICFRFKFYPADPMLLKEQVTRYQLVLKLRRDLLHGRLYSTLSDMAIVSSYIIQSELGDFDGESHVGNYVSEYELIARQSAELEERVKELHEELKGVSPAEADIMFLKKAASLDTYGVDPHPVKDQQGEQLYIGINHTGISTFEGSKKSTHFKWSQVTKLNYEGKMFIIHVSIAEDSRNKKKETVGYKCQTSSACKYLWRCAVEQRLFFTCGSGSEVGSVRGGGIFGSKFKYSGKVQKEILEDPGPLRAIDGVIARTPLYRSLQRNKTRSLSQSPMIMGYGSLPRSNHSAPSNDTSHLDRITLGSSASLPLSTLSSPLTHQELTLPHLETLEEDSPRNEEKEESPALLDTPPPEPSCSESEEPKEINVDKNEIDDMEMGESGAGGDQIKKEFKSIASGVYEDGIVPKVDESESLLRESRIGEMSSSSGAGVGEGGIGFNKGVISQIESGRLEVSMWKIFIICMICVLIALLFVAILAIEVDIDICQKMRRIPEVELFQTEVYDPLKFFIRDKIHNISDNINRTFQ